MKNIRKGLAVAVILLLIGIAFAPSINGNVGKEELIEIATTFSGIGEIEPHTVKLTKSDALRFESLFDEINVKLKDAKSMEEAENIFNNAIVELNDLGLIPKYLGVKKAQELVTGKLRICRILDKIYSKSLVDINDNTSADSNRFCLISGEAKENMLATFYLSLPFRLFYLWSFWIYMYARENEMQPLMEKQFKNMIFLGFLLGTRILILPLYQRPFMFGGSIYYGEYVDLDYDKFYNPSEGWVTTYGLNGLKNWTGPMYGNVLGLSNIPFIWLLIQTICFTGVTGFFGLMFKYNTGHFDFYPRKYMGFACNVRLGPEPPMYFD